MGDVLTLIERQRRRSTRRKPGNSRRRSEKDAFTLEDFRDQLREVRKMGSLESILSMIPAFQR